MNHLFLKAHIVVMAFLTAGFLFLAGNASFSCSPGIPCTGYTVDTGANDDKAGYGAGGTNADNDEEEPASCDGDFMNQIYARAFMEAQRENIMNEVLIFKPDSVLEYSCFGEFVNYTATKAPPLFSESEYWREREIELSTEGSDPEKYPKERMLKVNLGEGHIFDGLQKLVMDPFNKYIENNFGHNYLGGNSTADEPGIVSEAKVNDSPECVRMQMIWHMAKCENFEHSNFRVLKRDDDIQEQDPEGQLYRKGYTEMDPRYMCDNVRKITEKLVEIYRNPAPEYESFEPGTPTEKYTWATLDGVRHTTEETKCDYSNPKLTPEDGGSCDPSLSPCAPPIPTGITVKYGHIYYYDPFIEPWVWEKEVKDFEDAICPNPGCFYQKKDNNIGICLPL